jgi:hypothetical protein
MTDSFQGVRQFSQGISQGIADHLNAPPQRRNLNRARWGTGLLAGGAYVAHSYVQDLSLKESVNGYFSVLHRPWDDSWPFYAWGGVMLFSESVRNHPVALPSLRTMSLIDASNT